jgi:hypothetical protein
VLFSKSIVGIVKQDRLCSVLDVFSCFYYLPLTSGSFNARLKSGAGGQKFRIHQVGTRFNKVDFLPTPLRAARPLDGYHSQHSPRLARHLF